MKIAVIGTGNVGKALAGTFRRAGHEVTLAAQDHAKARAVADEIGVEAAGTPAGAARGADVIVLAVPSSAIEDVAGALRGVTVGKVVVDVSNPLTPDYSALATDGGPSPAERLAEQLGDAGVVKAFNTIFAGVQADPHAHGTTVDGLYATDDERARDRIAELISSVGFRPVHVGGLRSARQLEALAFLNIRLQMQTGGDWRSAFVLVGAPAVATTSPVASGAGA